MVYELKKLNNLTCKTLKQNFFGKFSGNYFLEYHFNITKSINLEKTKHSFNL